MGNKKLQAELVQDKRLTCGVTAPRQPLTGLDIFHAHAGIPVVLVYKKGFDLAAAERALVETLKHYPMLTGRYKTDEQGHAYVDSNDAGMAWRVSRCKGAMPYGPEHPAKDDIQQFFKLVMPWGVVDKDNPLLQVNLFQWEDGGILMCCYAPHSLMDGSSYWGFMQNWSNACKGLEVKPPSFDRQVLIDAGQTPVDPAAYDAMVAPGWPAFIGTMARLGLRAMSGLKSEVLHVPLQTVQQWKAQAKAEMPESAGVSTVELVTAYVMKAMSPRMPHGIERSVGLVLDLRYKRRLKLPRDYFGNALSYAEARFSEEDLARQSVPVLAERCRPVSEQVDTPSLFKVLALTEQYRQMKKVWRLIFKPTVETLRAGLILNNVIQLPIYDIDLGGGTPDWYDICPMTIRMLMVVNNHQKDGGVVLHVTATKAELQALRASMAKDGMGGR